MIKDAHYFLNKYIVLNINKFDHVAVADDNQDAIDFAGIRNSAVTDTLSTKGFYLYASKVIDDQTIGCYCGIIPLRIKVSYILDVAPIEPVSYIGKLLRARPQKAIDYLIVSGQYYMDVPYLVCYDPTNNDTEKHIIRFNGENHIKFFEQDDDFLEVLKRLETNRS